MHGHRQKKRGLETLDFALRHSKQDSSCHFIRGLGKGMLFTVTGYSTSNEITAAALKKISSTAQASAAGANIQTGLLKHFHLYGLFMNLSQIWITQLHYSSWLLCVWSLVLQYIKYLLHKLDIFRQ